MLLDGIFMRFQMKFSAYACSSADVQFDMQLPSDGGSVGAQLYVLANCRNIMRVDFFGAGWRR